MNSDYLKQVQEVFTANSNAQRAASMASYMKNRFVYFGIESPKRKEISRPFLQKGMLPGLEEVPELMQQLWVLPQRELQYFALELIQKFARRSPNGWIDLYEQLIIQKSWWDTVDGLAATQVGGHFKRFPELISPYTERWMKSDNIWLQRTCLLFQLKYKDEVDFDLLKSFIDPIADSREFFIRKAIGWALRQYSKFRPKEVKEYVETQPLSNLSYREALKVIERLKT